MNFVDHRNSVIQIDFISIELLDKVMKNKLPENKYRVVISNTGGITIYFRIDEHDSNFLNHFTCEVHRERNNDYQTFQQFYEYPVEDIKVITDDEIEENYYYELLFSSENIVQESLLHLSSWIENKEKNIRDIPPVVTFYSYKGGVGRSAALAACSLLLAKKGKRVVILDFDLEAPGVMSYLIPNESQPSKGVLDYLIEKPILKDSFDSDRLKSLFFRSVSAELVENGELFVMPAAKIDYQYIKKMAHIDLEVLEKQPNKVIASLLEDINLAYKPDVILIDSRTGIVDMAGALLFSYSDLVCGFFYNNEQNRQGLRILIECIKARKSEGKYIPEFIFVHSPIRHTPGSEGDRGFHEEFVTYLKDIIPDSEDVMIDYIQRLESLERIDYKTFKDERLFKDYAWLVEHIESEVNIEHNEDTQLSIDDDAIREEILSELNFGGYVAEQEHYNDVNYFHKNFFAINEFENILSDNCLLVLGAKGSGKSVLFSVLSNQKNNIVPYLHKYDKNSKRKFIKVYNYEQGFFSIDQFMALEEKRSYVKIDGSVYWKRFWLVYAYCQLYKNRAELGLGSINWIYQEDMQKILDNNISTNLPYLIDYDTYWSVERELDLIDRTLKANNHGKIILLYDNLEKVFEHKKLRKEIVEGLLLFWQSKQNIWFNILSKIFLRIDIYKDAVSIQNKSHLANRIVEIVWTKEELFKLILKRALSSSQRLKSWVESNVGVELENSYNSQVKEVIIPDDDSSIKKIMEIIFGKRVREGKRHSFIYNWFYNRLRDGNDNLYPRDAINLLNKAVELCKNSITFRNKNTSNGAIIPGVALEHRDVYDKVCEMRFDALCEEYESKKELFKGLRDLRLQFPMERIELEREIRNLPIEQEDTISGIIENLIKIGVIETNKSDVNKFRMPDLYLRGFNAKRKGPR